MRIRTIIAAAAAPAALTAALLGTTMAPAAHAATVTAAGPGASNSVQVKTTGKNAFTYTDAMFGPVKVNETSHPNFDTVGATFTGGQTMTPGQTGTVEWYSDFGSAGPHAGQYGTLTWTVNADGTGYDGIVTYPAS